MDEEMMADVMGMDMMGAEDEVAGIYAEEEVAALLVQANEMYLSAADAGDEAEKIDVYDSMCICLDELCVMLNDLEVLPLILDRPATLESLLDWYECPHTRLKSKVGTAETGAERTRSSSYCRSCCSSRRRAWATETKARRSHCSWT